MTDPGKATTTDREPRGLTVTWPADDFERIEEAAKVLARRTEARITPTDIIRSGALRRAEEILGAA